MQLFQAAIESKLHPRVRVIIELICDVKCMEEAVVEMKYDANKAPLGKLTFEQIKAGYLALKRIDNLIESDKFVMKDLVQACNDFYTRWDTCKSTLCFPDHLHPSDEHIYLGS